MVAMVALFPTAQLGVELGSILLIFTGQVWNMAFSLYSSLKNIPREMQEAAQLYRLSWWQRFRQLELPYAAIGLVWNSMMSVAGGWFSLMACEMFVLGNRDLRLPGLGSYLQTAANAGRYARDRLGTGGDDRGDRADRPVGLAPGYRLERRNSNSSRWKRREAPRSPVLDFLRRSRLLPRAARVTVAPAREALTLYFARRQRELPRALDAHRRTRCMDRGVSLAAALGRHSLRDRADGRDAHGRFRRDRSCANLSGARAPLFCAWKLRWCWPDFGPSRWESTIGLRPRLSAIAQPLAQIAASVPATALFPVVLLLLIRIGRRVGHRLHGAAAARHAMVHPVQRDRRRQRHPDGSERSLRACSGSAKRRALAEIVPAGNFSLT